MNSIEVKSRTSTRSPNNSRVDSSGSLRFRTEWSSRWISGVICRIASSDATIRSHPGGAVERLSPGAQARARTTSRPPLRREGRAPK